MQNVLSALVSLITKNSRIACPCGYKTTSKARALKHLQTHPIGTGSISTDSDQVIWV